MPSYNEEQRRKAVEAVEERGGGRPCAPYEGWDTPRATRCTNG